MATDDAQTTTNKWVLADEEAFGSSSPSNSNIRRGKKRKILPVECVSLTVVSKGKKEKHQSIVQTRADKWLVPNTRR